jgi:hypothetical protein
LPRDELSTIIQDKYDIRGAFLVVFCAVVEQVANFPVTGYNDDGRGDEELEFEEGEVGWARREGREEGIDPNNLTKTPPFVASLLAPPRLLIAALTYNKRCGFTLNFEEHLDAVGAFCDFFRRFGGPKLMPRSAKSR